MAVRCATQLVAVQLYAVLRCQR